MIQRLGLPNQGRDREVSVLLPTPIPLTREIIEPTHLRGLLIHPAFGTVRTIGVDVAVSVDALVAHDLLAVHHNQGVGGDLHRVPVEGHLELPGTSESHVRRQILRDGLTDLHLERALQRQRAAVGGIIRVDLGLHEPNLVLYVARVTQVLRQRQRPDHAIIEGRIVQGVRVSRIHPAHHPRRPALQVVLEDHQHGVLRHGGSLGGCPAPLHLDLLNLLGRGGGVKAVHVHPLLGNLIAERKVWDTRHGVSHLGGFIPHRQRLTDISVRMIRLILHSVRQNHLCGIRQQIEVAQ